MKISTHVNKQLIVFTNNLDIASNNKDKEAIHDLRVALKRVFALRKILKQSVFDYELSFKPQFHHVKTIFRITGIIRDNQIMINHAHLRLTHNDYINFRKVCNKTIKSSFIELNETLNTQNIKKEVNAITQLFYSLDNLRADFVINECVNYISENEKLINQQLSILQCNYHLIRKWIKEQYYLLSILKDVYKYGINENLLSQKKELGSSLGDWHDLRVLHQHFIHAGLNFNEDIITSIEQEAISLLSNITSKL